jgi:hypothetical protein
MAGKKMPKTIQVNINFFSSNIFMAQGYGKKFKNVTLFQSGKVELGTRNK